MILLVQEIEEDCEIKPEIIFVKEKLAEYSKKFELHYSKKQEPKTGEKSPREKRIIKAIPQNGMVDHSHVSEDDQYHTNTKFRDYEIGDPFECMNYFGLVNGHQIMVARNNKREEI